MKKNYKICLFIVGFLLFITLIIGTSYGLYKSTHRNNTKDSTVLDCFKIYYSDSEYVEMFNIKTMLDENGKEQSPSTITIQNLCPTEEEIELRLNVLNGTTANIDALSIYTTGSIEQDTILYKNLPNAKTLSSNVVKSKLIGVMKIKPNETIRTNMKLWFNERKAPNMSNEAILIAKYELVDTNNSMKLTFAETLLNEYEEKVAPNFHYIATTNEGLNAISEDNGISYYFRGQVENNYVNFANHLWRVVKINNDNSVKLILQDNIDNKRYSENIYSVEYTGVKFLYNDAYIDNDINVYIKNWYEENILNKGLDKFVVENNFCNDANYTTTYYHSYFNAYERLINNANPTLACDVVKSEFGGKIYQKVGLLTADEASLAGGVYGIANPYYYLNNNTTFFTMTPTEYYNYIPFVMTVKDDGSLASTSTYTELGIRPVINLDSTITVSGSGTIDDPYTIDLD